MVAKSPDTKEPILDNALDLASTVGFEGLSTGKLATATEMSKSGLFAHFESKGSSTRGATHRHHPLH